MVERGEKWLTRGIERPRLEADWPSHNGSPSIAQQRVVTLGTVQEPPLPAIHAVL